MARHPLPVKTTSLRGLYYMLKHTIEGTKEKTFDDQDESDPIIEDVEVTLDSLREELHVYASNRGNLVGPITLVDAATRSIARGWAAPATHSLDRRAGRDPVQEVHGQVHPARRKGHGLAALQRRPLLEEAQLHPHATAAASRRAACGGCCTACTTS